MCMSNVLWIWDSFLDFFFVSFHFSQNRYCIISKAVISGFCYIVIILSWWKWDESENVKPLKQVKMNGAMCYATAAIHLKCMASWIFRSMDMQCWTKAESTRMLLKQHITNNYFRIVVKQHQQQQQQINVLDVAKMNAMQCGHKMLLCV